MKHVRPWFLMLLPLWSLSGEAEIEFKGTAEMMVASTLEDSAEMMVGRTRFRPQWEAFAGKVYFKAALDCVYDDLIPSETGIALQEIYMEYAGDIFDIRAGRQILSWGKADGIQIIDILSPKNRKEFVGIEYEDSRLPVNALKTRLFGQAYTLEFIWIPLFTPSEYPTDTRNPLTEIYFPSRIGTEQIRYDFVDGNLPDSLWDSEAALRLSFFLPLMDLSLSAFSGWEDDPEFHSEIPGSVVIVTPEYYRIMMYGMDAAVPVNAFVFRWEAAFFDGRRFIRDDSSDEWAEEYQILALAGLDWNPGREWTLTAQYEEDILPDAENGLERDGRERSATLSISKNLFKETLEISCFSIVGLNNLDSAHSLSAEYLVNDNLKILAGADLFFSGPEEEGDYGAMEGFSSFWVKGRFSF